MPKFRLTEDLFEYQKEDSNAMARGNNFLNFSEMGTGKTPQALAVIEANQYQCPLIICPNSLRLEWKRQIEEWIGEGITAVSHPDCYFRLEPIVRSFMNGQKYKIINYETLRNKANVDMLNAIPFDCIILDEIHKLRNPKTQNVKGAWRFLDAHPNAKTIGLSGSPIMNYPNDLYVPLSIIAPEQYPRTLMGWRQFMYKYCLWSDGRNGPYIYGTRSMGELKKETSPYIIRRTKKEVLPFLPDKYYRRTLLEMQPDQRKVYNEMETQLRILLDSGEPLWSTSVLATLTRLRQLNLDPKILGISKSSAKTDFIVDTIESTDEKLVIFSCFEKYIYLLSLLFPNNSITITGEVPVDERIRRVKRFQEDDKVKLCLGTIQTMGEGLTLTASSNCILADRWWNEPTNQQAVDRTHRIGQKNSVQVIYPIVQNSIDETLDSILEGKSKASQEYYQETQVRQLVIEDRTRR